MKNQERTIFVKTFGCAFNQSDSQIMKKKLIDNNFKISEDNEANIVLLNSCTVKNLSESKLFNDIKKYEKEGKKIIVGGCIPQAQKSYLQTKFKNVGIVGVNNLDSVVQVAENLLEEKPLQILSNFEFKISDNIRKAKEDLRLENDKIRDNPIVEIIPINEGCLNSCTFCKTKQARGNLVSYSTESIKKALKRSIAGGAKEIWLTSQDTACYGFDINTNLPNLLKELIKIEGDYKIRIGMGNPNHFKNIIDEVLDIISSTDKIYKFLHIPLQSGSDRVLKEMNRGYNIEDYQKIISKIQVKMPNLTIANDIIVAYPTETNEEFEKTICELKKSRTNVLNFSRFWLRPGTLAEKKYAKKDFIPGDESKIRAKKIKEEFEKMAYKQNKKLIGKELDVLIVEKGKEGTKSFVCRDEHYRPIIIKDNHNIKIGDKIKIKVEKVTWFDFRAKIV